jgi:hypothetical protein
VKTNENNPKTPINASIMCRIPVITRARSEKSIGKETPAESEDRRCSDARTGVANWSNASLPYQNFAQRQMKWAHRPLKRSWSRSAYTFSRDATSHIPKLSPGGKRCGSQRAAGVLPLDDRSQAAVNVTPLRPLVLMDLAGL